MIIWCSPMEFHQNETINFYLFTFPAWFCNFILHSLYHYWLDYITWHWAGCTYIWWDFNRYSPVTLTSKRKVFTFIFCLKIILNDMLAEVFSNMFPICHKGCLSWNFIDAFPLVYITQILFLIFSAEIFTLYFICQHPSTSCIWFFSQSWSTCSRSKHIRSARWRQLCKCWCQTFPVYSVMYAWCCFCLTYHNHYCILGTF